MEDWLYQMPLVGLVGAVVVAALVSGVIFIAKQFLQDPKKKAVADKVLLKELLEGFGLEVPEELNESETPVIKPIKTP